MDPLVSTQWLAERLGAEDLFVLDASSHLPDAARDSRGEFVKGHIPGARFLDVKALTDPRSAVPAALPTRAQFERHMAMLGITQGATLIMYDDSALPSSARAWFICRLHGIADVAVIDGGLSKWRREGHPLESGVPQVEPTQFFASAGTGDVRQKAQILANIESGAEQVVDARPAARFSGEEGDFRAGVAAGHIPGSVNLSVAALLNDDGTYKDEHGIRAAFAQAGVDLDRPVVTTCGSGLTACVLLPALHRIGKHDVALYDGSWSEWGADPALPKATGAAA